MRQLTLVLLVALLFNTGGAYAQKSGHLEWQTDLMKAMEISNKTHKPIFAFFTGSDWCGWCHKLQNEVFSKAEFIKWAKDHVILLEVDFPRGKQLPQELMAQNSKLQQTFKVQGYPTCWLFNMTKDPATNNFSIQALGSLGYPSDATQGKEEVAFLKTANGILANK